MYFLFLVYLLQMSTGFKFDKNGQGIIELIEPRMIELDKRLEYALTKIIENSQKNSQSEFYNGHCPTSSR